MQKTSEIYTDTKATYILCPDKECNYFYDTSRRLRCDRNCPYGDKMKMIIVCGNCGKNIELPYNHSMCYRVDCKCGACNFQRMSGRYRLKIIQDEK